MYDYFSNAISVLTCQKDSNTCRAFVPALFTTVAGIILGMTLPVSASVAAGTTVAGCYTTLVGTNAMMKRNEGTNCCGSADDEDPTSGDYATMR